jgi:hypothetical protein
MMGRISTQVILFTFTKTAPSFKPEKLANRVGGDGYRSYQPSKRVVRLVVLS